MPLGPRLRQLRREAHLTQAEVAQAAGIERSYVSRLEKGITPLPSTEVLRALAPALHTTVDDLAMAAFNGAPRELSDEQTRLLMTYFKELEPDDRGVIIELARVLAARRELARSSA